MNQSPAQQWSALSALYEQADGLAADALAAWLAQLEREANPLLPQLQRMLAARAEFETNDFLGTLPKLPVDDPKAGAHWAEGRQVGPYRLLRPLGEGGMAEVWLAERVDGSIKRRVAIKLPYPRPGRETFALRFDRERDILATLRHPNIAGLYDAGVTADGQAWLALEYVDGEPLSAWCDGRRLGLRERVTLFRQVLLAVQHAHANLVIHRDLKPANILVTAQGEVRLLDFGIAKLLEAEGDAMPETELTRQAGRTLTPRYASPEQLTGVPLTTACDVYSLGVVFYELISGERPYELKVESAAQLEHAILEAEPRAPSRRTLTALHAKDCAGISVKALRKALAPELDAIALRCLAKQPSARYASVDAVIADIDRWLGGEAVLARAPGAWYRFGKFAARHRIGVGLGVGAVLSLVAVAAVAVVLGLQAREESARAVAARDFMLNIFKRADQEKARGADITARDILETGRKDVLTRLAGQPRLQAELLQGIAEVQREMGEFAAAASTFGEVASLDAQQNLPNETALARADQAEASMNAGNLDEATRQLDQAKAVPGRSRADPALSARLSEVAGWIEYSRGNAQLARTAFVEAQGLALAAYSHANTRPTGPLRGLIYAEEQLKNYDEALRRQAELETAVIASSPTGLDPKQRARLDEGRSSILYKAGRYAEGLSDTTISLERCEASLVPNDLYCRRLRLLKFNFATRTGSIYAVEHDVPSLEALARDATTPGEQADAVIVLLRFESMKGRSQRQRELFSQVVALCERDTLAALEPQFKSFAMLALAESSLRMRAPDVARGWIERAASGQGESTMAAGTRLHAVSTLLSGVAYLHLGQAQRAVLSLQAAQDEMSALLGAQHAMTRLFSLNLALAFDALGRTDAALKVARDADPVLLQALGASSLTYVRLKRLEQRLQGKIEAQAHGVVPRGTEAAKAYGPTAAEADFFS